MDARKTAGKIAAATALAATVAVSVNGGVASGRELRTPGQELHISRTVIQANSLKTSGDCTYFLYRAGYALTNERVAACNDDGLGGLLCMVKLANTGVDSYDAEAACRLQ
ncbi:hypothetical protein ACWEGE_41725 [Amycolatopsis sp. NPDC004747]